MKRVSLFGQVKDALKDNPPIWMAIQKEANSFANKEDQEDFLLSILAFVRFGIDRTRRGALPEWMTEKIRQYQNLLTALEGYASKFE